MVRLALPSDPRNDAKENYYTTLKGTVNKFIDDDPEFDLPQGLIDLYESKISARMQIKTAICPLIS